jgi:ribonucleotide monophosphatase NagD (HAD superfamily)
VTINFLQEKDIRFTFLTNVGGKTEQNYAIQIGQNPVRGIGEAVERALNSVLRTGRIVQAEPVGLDAQKD